MSNAGDFYDQFLTQWMAMIEQSDALALDKLQAGAEDRLQEWKRRGMSLYLVTMRREKLALDDQLANLGLRHFLDEVITVDHALGGEGKADAARDRLPGYQTYSDCVWIGDTEADWEAARSLGDRVILLSNGLRNENYLRLLEGAIVRPSIAALPEDIWSVFREN
jgi:phosphoglycolate phosphatase-like HAD superfamily hydrolase